MGQVTDALRALGTEPVGVAVTATFSQQAFARALGLDFPLLSDWSRDVCRSYGVQYDVWKGHDGLARRSLFLIDHGGTVRYRWETADASVVPDFGDVLAVAERHCQDFRA